MATDTQLTGADYPLKLSGMEFKARTLTDRDSEEINTYIQSKVIETGKMAITSETSPIMRKEVLTAAISAATGLTWGSAEGSRVMATIEGMCRLAWQMIKHGNAIEFEKLMDHIRGKGPEILRVNMEEIDSVFMILNTDFSKVDEVSEEDTSDSPKSTERRDLPAISNIL